jgi:glycosyltransferase involved in cell wall biosynthesis
MKISIITPSYNQAKHLRSTLDSIHDPGYSELEHIVIDGGSTDGSVDIIREYADKLAFWCSEPDGGQYQAINKGFEKSTGEIMAWLNSSDLYLPWTLASVTDIFSRFPEIDWISSRRKVCVTEGGVFEGLVELSGFSSTRLAAGLHGGPVNGDFIQQETCFWRRSLWEKIGGQITDNYRFAADFWLWGEFFKHARCTGVEAPLAAFRFHGDQRSVDGSYMREIIEILRELNDEDARKRLISGFQNLHQHWTVDSPGATGKSSLRIHSTTSNEYLGILIFWEKISQKAKWRLAGITFFFFLMWKYFSDAVREVRNNGLFPVIRRKWSQLRAKKG